MDLGSSTEGTQLTKHVIKKKREKRELCDFLYKFWKIYKR